MLTMRCAVLLGCVYRCSPWPLTGMLTMRRCAVLLGCVLALFIFVVIILDKRLTGSKGNSFKTPEEEKTTSEQAILEQIRRYTKTLPNTSEVSVVTAYFDLGTYKRTYTERSPDMYKTWMSTFGWLDNSVVFFTDSPHIADHFQRLRARYRDSLFRTTTIVLNRQQLWAFQRENEIQQIFAQPDFPHHAPNTINALYSCAMHAKFELVQKVLRERLYQTRFVAWLDIGLFRGEASKNRTIHLTAPTDFQRTRVAYSQVDKFITMTPQDVIRRNRVWVGGASFLATPEVAYVYCSEYRRAVRKLLDMKWMSTDQQVIYIMFQPSFNLKPQTKIQTYTKNVGNKWFSMGYLMNAAP